MDHDTATVINALIGLLGKLVWPAVAIVFLLAFRESAHPVLAGPFECALSQRPNNRRHLHHTVTAS
jgi:hypothetical protein